MRRHIAIESMESRCMLSVSPTFAPDSNFYTGGAPVAVATGDFNKDGNLDFITADEGTGTVTIRRGRGDGTFRPASTIAVGSRPAALVVADFNKDGNLDFAVALRGETSVVSYKGNGAGGFTQAGRVGTGNLGNSDIFDHEVAMVSGDFDGDAKLDLAVSSNVTGAVYVLRGKGTGAFFFRVTTAVPNDPSRPADPPDLLGLAAADLNGDGKTDLVTAAGGEVVNVLRATSGGRFTLLQQFGFGDLPLIANPHDLTIAHLNGDSILDLAITSGGSDGVGVFLGQGGGIFAFDHTEGVNGQPDVQFDRGPFAIAQGDFNKDGVVDLVTANVNSSTRTVLTNDGTGQFSILETPTLDDESEIPNNPTYTPVSVAVGDFTKDGKLDIVLANWNDNNITLVVNTTVL
jgi:hypothetical protein